MASSEHATQALNLYQRLNAVMAEIGTIEKTGNMSGQGNYKFIEQSVLMAKLRPLFVTHGIVFIPEILSSAHERVDGNKMVTSRCQMRFTLVNADNPTEQLQALWASEGADFGDKGVNKAGTSGAKYFLMKLLLISDKDDPDADAVDEPKQAARHAPGPVPATKAHYDEMNKLAEQVYTTQGKDVRDKILEGMGAVDAEALIRRLKLTLNTAAKTGAKE